MEPSMWLALIAIAGSTLAGIVACLSRIKNCRSCCCTVDIESQQRPPADPIQGELVDIIAQLSRDRSSASDPLPKPTHKHKEKKKKKKKEDTSPTSPTDGAEAGTAWSFSTTETEEQQENAKSQPLDIHTIAP